MLQPYYEWNDALFKYMYFSIILHLPKAIVEVNYEILESIKGGIPLNLSKTHLLKQKHNIGFHRIQ